MLSQGRQWGTEGVRVASFEIQAKEERKAFLLSPVADATAGAAVFAFSHMLLTLSNIISVILSGNEIGADFFAVTYFIKHFGP